MRMPDIGCVQRWDNSFGHESLSSRRETGSHVLFHTRSCLALQIWAPTPGFMWFWGSELRGSWSQGRVYSRSHLPSPLVFLRWELCYAAQAGFELAVILLLLPPAYGSICRSVSLHLALLFFCQRVSTLQMELRVGWDREKLSCNARSWLLGFGSLGFPCSCFGAMFYVNFGWFHIPGMF